MTYKENIMDAKLTLSFDEAVIERAKKFADRQGISLSRFVEILLRKATTKSYDNIEDLPIADWVMEVAEGKVEYRSAKRTRKSLKEEYYNSKK